MLNVSIGNIHQHRGHSLKHIPNKPTHDNKIPNLMCEFPNPLATKHMDQIYVVL